MNPEATQTAAPKRRSLLKIILTALIGVFLLRVLLELGMWALRDNVVQTYHVPAGSMEPTILIGDHIFVTKRDYRERPPGRGDLVVFRSPENPEVEVIKRVVAIPGDHLEIRDKKIYINDQPQEEPYVVHRDTTTYSDPSSSAMGLRRDNAEPQVIPEGTFFLMGDNRDLSYDSRFFGPVERSLIIGRPRSIYWSYGSETGIRWDRIGKTLR